MVITAVMMHRQRAIVRAFERAGAVTATQARRASELAVTPGMAWQQLVGHAVLRCPGDGRYFLDVANWQRLCRRRRFTIFAVTGGLLMLLLAALLLR